MTTRPKSTAETLATRTRTSDLEDLFLPDPEPREVQYTVISVDDHLVEPAHAFEGRLPRHLQDRAPRVIEDERGKQQWLFDGQTCSITAGGFIAGLRHA